MSVLVEGQTTAHRRPEVERARLAHGTQPGGRPMRRTRAEAVRRPPAGVRAAGQPRMVPASCVIIRQRRMAPLLAMIVAGACAVVVLAGWAIGGLADAASRVPERTALVTVEPGQSLWDIATTYAPASDPRAVIDRIEELNDLMSDSVPAGYPLSVPVQSSS